ncbi:MAG: CDP-paratose 2-epimerase [Blastocatellia bacterium]|jgi:CDP-paratose 2-epimerase|nr:CDP-paratose 2-epimerase [Blastocatellia bacterium]
MRILITGGAGFIGSSLALFFKHEDSSAEVVAVDNLKRRGAELNLDRFRKAGVQFVHGDIRNQSDLDDLAGNFDVFIEASAEPSVLAGVAGSPQYLLQTNLVGTLNCLEFARRRAASFVFLSTSRVYSIRPLREIKLVETDSRFEIGKDQTFPGVSENGVAEDFPVHLPRSMYGATKLASELIVQEYAESYGLRAVINRCGVIAGPGQFGKVDQGVFTLWVAKHFYRRPLRYTGFGGEGKQVRDLLHPADLFSLLKEQLAGIEKHSGAIFNIGGGRAGSTSLLELTALCREVSGNEVPIAADPETSSVDIPLYISDCRKANQSFSWRPERPVKDIVKDIFDWLKQNEAELKPLFT